MYSVIDHLTRFVVLIPIKSKRSFCGRWYAISSTVYFLFSGPPETLPSDQGEGFEGQPVKELPSVMVQENRTAAYRQQGRSVLGRVHSTVHNMLAMYSNLACDDWAEVLPFVQLAHKTAYSKTFEETPHYLMFGRAVKTPCRMSSSVSPLLLIRKTSSIILVVQLFNWHVSWPVTTSKNARISKQLRMRICLSPVSSRLAMESFSTFCPYHETDGPNPKLNSPWHGPYTVRAHFVSSNLPRFQT